MNNYAKSSKKHQYALKKYERELEVFNHIQKGFDAEESGNIELSVREFEISAKMGSVIAQSKLATILDDVIKPRRSSEAVYWYKRAIKLGDSSCAWNLAMHYKNELNLRWYMHWLKIAEKMGDFDARQELKTRKWWNKKEKELNRLR